MNIFLFDPLNLKSQAQNHPDKLVVKMQLEICQLLNNQLSKEDYFYKPTHLNHPCSKWLGENYINLSYGLKYLESLIHEYEYRYKKLSSYRGHLDYLSKHIEFVSELPISYAIAINEFWLKCMLQEETISSCEYTQILSTKKANAELAKRVYQRYLLLAKCHYAEWRHSSAPTFWGVTELLSKHKGRFCAITKDVIQRNAHSNK